MSSNIVCCPLCQSTQAQFLFHSSSNADGTLKEKIRMFTCLKCNTKFTDPLVYLRNANPILQYEGGIYQSKKNRLSKIVDAFLAVLIDFKINKIANICKPNVNLLDVGCGKGRFLSRVKRQKGWSGLGIEPSQKQAEFGINNYGIEVVVGNLTDSVLNNKTFDIITCWHVIEHIDDPFGFMTPIYNLLSDDGLLVIEVPNSMSLQAKIGREKWFQLDMPRHVIHYAKDSMELLLNSSGLSIQRIETFSFDLGVFGLLQTILNLIGYSPNLFFRWLKKCKLSESRVEIISTIILAAILYIPSMIIEFIVSTIFKSGGILRIYARKNR